jgi:hypothetical protein
MTWLRELARNRALRNGESKETALRAARSVVNHYVAGHSAESALRLYAGPPAKCQGAE